MSRDLDMSKTTLQGTGRCNIHNFTVAEVLEIVTDLGLDPRGVFINTDTLYVSERVLENEKEIQRLLWHRNGATVGRDS